MKAAWTRAVKRREKGGKKVSGHLLVVDQDDPEFPTTLRFSSRTTPFTADTKCGLGTVISPSSP